MVSRAFSGIRICVCALILDAVLRLGKKSVADAVSVVIFAVILLLSLFSPISTVWLVIGAGVCGYVIYLTGGKKK